MYLLKKDDQNIYNFINDSEFLFQRRCLSNI